MAIEYDPDKPLDEDTRQRLLERNRWEEVEENDRKFGEPTEPELQRGDPRSGSSSESAPGSEDPINPEGEEADEETIKIAKERATNPEQSNPDVMLDSEGDDPRAGISDGEDSEVTPEDPEDPNNLLKPELKAELNRRDISYPRGALKSQLVELLRQDEENKSGSGNE